MRLEGISLIAGANAFLPGYMARHNQRLQERRSTRATCTGRLPIVPIWKP